jgi:hypothetical protein
LRLIPRLHNVVAVTAAVVVSTGVAAEGFTVAVAAVACTWEAARVEASAEVAAGSAADGPTHRQSAADLTGERAAIAAPMAAAMDTVPVATVRAA